MSNITGACADYIHDMMLEIGQNFYPLPAIFIADEILTYPLDAIEDEYDFEVEHGAVVSFDKAREAERKAEEEAERKAQLDEEEKLENEKANQELIQNNSNSDSEVETELSVLPKAPLAVLSVSLEESLTSITADTSSTWIKTPDILQPEKASNLFTKINILPRQQISFADFESSSASPFDALEIKTIDDKAMLRQVLEPDTILAPNLNQNGIVNVSASFQSEMVKNEIEPNRFYASYPIENGVIPRRPETLPNMEMTGYPLKPSKSSPDLTQLSEEKKDLIAAKLQQNIEPFASVSLESIEKEDKNGCESIDEFSLNDQQKELTNGLCSMGFNRSQVVRAVKRGIGPNRGQIVNYLLLVQSLSRAGWPVEIVEEAVIICDLNEEKASQYTRIALQLRGLGFVDNQIMEALKMCQGSRDKALEYILKH